MSLNIPDELFLVEERGDDEEMIPLLSSEEEINQGNENIPEDLPILPLRNTVLFPGVVMPVTVGRQKSIKLVKKAYRGNRFIGTLAQLNPEHEDPEYEDLYQIGTVAKIIKMLVLPDGNTTIIIQGKKRFRVSDVIEEDPHLIIKPSLLNETFDKIKKSENKALIQSIKDNADKILKLNTEIPQEAQVAIKNIESLFFLTHFLASNLSVEVADKQKILETNDGYKRVTMLLEYLLKDLRLLEIKSEIQSKVSSDLDQQQRDYFLRQQIKVLQDELGIDTPEKELENLKNKAAKMEWPEYAAKQFHKELDKINRMNPAAAEYPVAMNYVELLTELPWNKVTKDNFDLKSAEKVLDTEHYGLKKVKERILEYLAVLKLKNDMKAPILCFYGPPGVGKTSLGKSIAKALKRKYARMSLGGVHDEAEIRGHRRTYVGAMPGKIIQNLKKSDSSNPVFVLDEIEKVGADFKGDPSSALLEVLDPEQNDSFVDNYLEVEYDLSKILFIATSNSLDSVHPALRDRMEIIEINGYTLEEKVQIAKKHLIPKQRKEHGLKADAIKFSDAGLKKIIDAYTRESGVRNLERNIASVIRNVAKNIAMEQEYQKTISPEQVVNILGPERFESEVYEKNDHAGVVTGLAWTSAGGEILFIESSVSRGKGKLTISGQLGDVMKESASAALSFLKANAGTLSLDYRIFDQFDLHIHVPAGAIPKDGPSAGITMLTSLASVFTQRKVKANLAMTGEITLRGKVLPVGGIKEKLLAARRSGVKTVLLSEKNRKDVEEVEEQYLKGLKIDYVANASEVLEIALTKEKVNAPQDLSILNGQSTKSTQKEYQN